MTSKYAYDPDHVQPPGHTIQDYLDALDISARELARRCGRSAKLLTEIIAGKAALEPTTALQLERVLGISATVLLNMEADYRLHLARTAEDEELATQGDWAKRFPLKELQQRGYIASSKGPSDQVRKLLQFFGAGNIGACEERFTELKTVAFRHSPSFDSSAESLIAWLRIGELRAETIACADYDRARFLQELREIRSLTSKPIEVSLPEIVRRCASAGVAFLIEKPFKGIALSGISRWISPKKAIIQQTLRHLSDDHFWFTFYHECAHLLLHSRKSLFIDDNANGNAQPEEEAEANDWAANFLIANSVMTRFITRFTYTEDEIIQFAGEQGVAPGIVVGQLQHRKVLGYHQMNSCKKRLQWTS